jgi:hypothetical protein
VGDFPIMQSLVKADDKHRIPIKGTKAGRQYLVVEDADGWRVTPAATPEPARRNKLQWAGTGKSLAEALRRLKGLELEQAPNAREKVGPCRF